MTKGEILELINDCFETCIREYSEWLDNCTAVDSEVEYYGIISTARMDGAEGLLKLIKDRLNEKE